MSKEMYNYSRTAKTAISELLCYNKTLAKEYIKKIDLAKNVNDISRIMTDVRNII